MPNSGAVRVVLDTNILISACWKPGGLESQTVGLARTKAFSMCVSPAVWGEYRDVLFRDKFAAYRERAQELLSALESQVIFVTPRVFIRAAESMRAGTQAGISEAAGAVQSASDDDDNRFLECAAEACADYLITGNLKHFPARWGGTKILNAREFLETSFGLK